MFALKARKVKSSSMLTSEIFGWRSTSNLSNVVWTSATHHGEKLRKIVGRILQFVWAACEGWSKKSSKKPTKLSLKLKIDNINKKSFPQWISLTSRTCKGSWVVNGSSQPVWLQQRGYPDSSIQTKNFKNFYTMEIPSASMTSTKRISWLFHANKKFQKLLHYGDSVHFGTFKIRWYESQAGHHLLISLFYPEITT